MIGSIHWGRVLREARCFLSMETSSNIPNRGLSFAFSLWGPLVLIGESGSNRRDFPRLVSDQDALE